MSDPMELSFDEILKFMLAHNGKVTNYELVKHFKRFLTNPDMRDEARSTFKKHVNTLAIIKNQNNEKWLILKKKYMINKENEVKNDDPEVSDAQDAPADSSTSVNLPPYRPPPPIQLNQDFSILNSIIQDRNGTGTVATPLSTSNTPMEIPESDSTQTLGSVLSLPSEPLDDVPPKVHPRRKSADKIGSEKRSSIPSLPSTPKSINPPVLETDEVCPILTSSKSDSMLVDSEQKISVKERKQMFNRMASEGDVLKTQNLSGNLSQNADEDDRISLDQKSESGPLDPNQKQWILCSSRGDYHALAKMCKEYPKLVKTKDPFMGYTALHWACKRGDENLVKLLAGTTRDIVNARTNGGYTPLHIAMQFRHKNVYNLLVKVYDADPNARDWSGKKPAQYEHRAGASLSPGSYRKKESFLRIGSLNVRVKKTTEAFSNFLGVGATKTPTYVTKREREDRRSEDIDHLHKTWGSADNIPKDDKAMPPPMSTKVRRRGPAGRKGLAAHSRSTPSTPDQGRAHIGVIEGGDSDSDSAAGFHSAWRQRASNCT